jgi:signal transduction histidine kinase
MRSLYVKILLWCFGTLLASLVGFVLVSWFIVLGGNGRGSPFERLNALQLADAKKAFKEGGAPELAARLAHISNFLPGQYYLTDTQGRDLVSGEDRSALLGLVASRWDEPQRTDDKVVIATTDSERRYCLIVLIDPPVNIRHFVPYYLLILVAVGVLSWVFAVSMASPLRHLTRAVERFGSGELSARAPSTRKDEIGELARAFNDMADRIATLLAAERQLLQDVSHELRSPLARLRFAIQLSRSDEDRDTATAQMDKETERLSELVGALLQVTREEGDPSSHRSEPVQIAPLIEDILEGCEYEAKYHGCGIRSCLDPAAIVYGDPEMLRRAIENIVENAIRYAPKQSDVEVALRIDKGAISVMVRDYGPGVPREDLERIFTPFYRVDPSRDVTTGGIGLGLAIARRAVALNYGTLRADNANPGLRVSIVLPAVSTNHN